jgi:ABC-type phosphate transport system auxiliary subunit
MAAYRLIAVTAEGFGLTYSWGDAYEVQAKSYAAAEADVLGRVGANDEQPYTQVKKAWVMDGRSWTELELEDE